MSGLRLLVPGLRFPLREGEPDRSLRLAEQGVGGFCIFSAPADVGDLIARLQDVAPHPLLIASDIEHGVGQQVEGGRLHPSAGALGPDAAEVAGIQTGFEARSHGITMAFAPVCDVASHPRNPIIHARAFPDPQRSAPRFVIGARRMGLRTCAKHFPGHGATALDSHEALPRVDADVETWHARDLPPFRACIEAGVDAVMTAHLACPALTGSSDLPATLSRRVLKDLLRGELGFSGVIVTDALLMEGVLAGRTEVEAARAALLAGCDILLCPADVEGVAGMLGEIDAGESLARLARVAEPLPDLLRVAARASVTGARGPVTRPGDLPIRICDLHGRGRELARHLGGLAYERFSPDGVRIGSGGDSAHGTADPIVIVARSDRAWGGPARVPAEIGKLARGAAGVVVLGPRALLDDLAPETWIHAPGEDRETLAEVLERLLGA